MPYCDSCQPSEILWHNVMLSCGAGADELLNPSYEHHNNDIDNEQQHQQQDTVTATASSQTTYQLKKRVQIIKNCSCSSCHATAATMSAPPSSLPLSSSSFLPTSFPQSAVGVNSNADTNSSNSGSNIMVNDAANDNDMDMVVDKLQNDIPEFVTTFKKQQTFNDTKDDDISNSPAKEPNNYTTGIKDDVDDVDNEMVLNKNLTKLKIIALLQHEEMNEPKQFNKMQLIELLRSVQYNNAAGGDKTNTEQNEKNISDLVESLNGSNLSIKDLIKKIEKSSAQFYATKVHDDQNEPFAETPNFLSYEMRQSNKVFDDINIKKDEVSDDETTEEILPGHLLENHLQPQHHHHHNKKLLSDDPNHHHHSHHHGDHHHNHHHHAGEHFGHGHLVKGPRGALVIEPDDNTSGNDNVVVVEEIKSEEPVLQHEELHVNLQELQLNNAGTILNYHGSGSSSSSSSSESQIFQKDNGHH